MRRIPPARSCAPGSNSRDGQACSRRSVLQGIALGACALPLLRASLARAQAKGEAAGEVNLAVVRNGPPADLTRRAIEALGGMQRFVSPGSRVVLKPNIGWDRTPEQGADTHPEVVAALTRLALDAGARKVVVLDHTCNDARRCYARSGIEAAAKAAGAEVLHLPEGRGTEMNVGGEIVRAWPVHREVIEADLLINVPAAKHHSLTRASLGMKNWLGAIDGRRNQLHQEIDRASVDLAAFFKPGLTLLDATRLLLRNGPQGGDAADVAATRIVMAGIDPVAIEAFGAQLLKLGPGDLPHIAMAEARGLGHANLARADLTEIDLQS
jgi:uncharacterized protein (DUF362 family)